MDGLEGTALGRYYLEQRLGHGGMSEVYLAYDERMCRRVALKVVSGSHTDYLERFRREAEAIGRLDHDHILPAFDYGDQGPWHYLVMPYIDGGTLRDRLEHGPLTLEDASEMLEQIASALQFAHENGIIHRDIKPSNILLRSEHYAYLADFGLAKSLRGENEITQTGALLGTPEYMAPDLADGPASMSSDIYALGILLYQMITGYVPFSGETPVSVYWKHIREQPAPPSHFNPAIPPAIDEVVLHALEKDPRRRFRTALALSRAFNHALSTLQAPDLIESEPAVTGEKITRPEVLDATDAADHEPVLERELAPREVYDKAYNKAYKAYSPPPAWSPAAPSPPRLPRFAGRRTFHRRRTSLAPDQLILPDNPLAAPSGRREQAATSTARDSGDEMLPPLPMRAIEQESRDLKNPTTPVETYMVPRQLTKRRRSPREIRLIVGIMSIGILLFIVLPMVGFIYYDVSHPSASSSSTAGVDARATQEQKQADAAMATAQATPRAQATATAQSDQHALATATAQVAVNATTRTPLLVDNLASNADGHWPEDQVNCVFSSESYHVIATQRDYLQPCALQSFSLSNAAFQVDVSLLTAHDAGMMIRASGQQFYDFEINNHGQFYFRRHDNGGGTNYTTLIHNTTSSAIMTGAQKNTLLVIANGDDFKLYINGIFGGETHDNTYVIGQFALVSGTVSNTSVGESSFTNLKIFNVE